jgi:hypothetical protein
MRFPERWLNDRRVARLSDAAFRLFVTSLAWSVSNRTDGEIDVADLALVPRIDPSAASDLVSVGLWRQEGDKWLICDFVSTQTTRDALDRLESIRRAEREKKQRQRSKEGTVPGNVPGAVPVDSRGQERLEARTGQAGLEVSRVKEEPRRSSEPPELNGVHPPGACKWCGRSAEGFSLIEGMCRRCKFGPEQGLRAVPEPA